MVPEDHPVVPVTAFPHLASACVLPVQSLRVSQGESWHGLRSQRLGCVHCEGGLGLPDSSRADRTASMTVLLASFSLWGTPTPAPSV
jgi:hypothetical protein